MVRNEKKTKRKHQRQIPSSSFEQALQTFENHERPTSYQGFDGTTRRLASTEQFRVFHGKYWPQWRHEKIRLYLRLLKDRASILADETARWEAVGQDPTTLVYREMTNGLVASIISEFCQYAEDLGLLCHACKSPDFFVRDLGSANAGRIQSSVKGWADISDKDAAYLLQIPVFPSQEEWEGSHEGQTYLAGQRLTADRLRAIGELYTAWEMHFMRYKHGALLALRGSGKKSEEPPAVGDRQELGFPVAFDCGSIKEAVEQDGQAVIIIPDIGPDSSNVRLNAAHLAKERNLLREIHPPLELDWSAQRLEEVAGYIAQLQRVLLANKYESCTPSHGSPYYMATEAVEALMVTRHLPDGADLNLN